MAPPIRGEFYHAVQARLYTSLRADNLLPVRDIDAALPRLDATLSEVSAEFAARYMPAIPIIWENDLERIRGDLRAWLRHVSIRENEWLPIEFEYRFDDIAIDGSLLLQGRIDLVEQHDSGALRVTDHKTTTRPDKPPLRIGGGESLQPALYAMAASEILQRPVQTARLFYSTLRGNYTELPFNIDDETRQSAIDVLHQIDKALRDGELPAAPRKEGCKHCEYLSICGPYEEERVAKKDQRALRNLKALRAQR
jgi:ATP-dependent helicase/nuclease subunit B